MRIGWKIRELFTIFLQISSNNFFPKRGFLFHKGNFFSQTARCSLTPMSLGSSASFRRIVPFRDTSTMESEIPSFRDAKPHESWELVPLDELSLPGILQLWNQRFQVSGMQSPLSPSPYPPPRFVVGSFGFVGRNWILRHSEKGKLGYQFQLPTFN